MYTIEQYREAEFSQSIAQGCYLNHAASSPMPSRVKQAISQAVEVSASNPEAYFMEYVWPALGSVRARLADLMGVPAEDVALTRNTAHGLAIVADGLQLDPGDNVLVAGCEYPAVVYPWYGQRWRGVETRIVAPEPDGTLTVEAFARQIDSRTRVLALSWVQFATGFRADLAEFAALAKAHNLVFVLDAIQALGVLPLDASALGIDVVVTGAQKWLLGPHGTGGLYIDKNTLDRMNLVNMGACSVIDIPKFDPLVFDIKPNAQRYEEGTPNGLGAIGLDKSIELLQEVGIETVAERVSTTTRTALEALDAKGYRVTSPREDERRAGIVLFEHPTLASDDILKILRDKGVFASVRSGRVRFSPHFYNTTDDIDTAIAALP